MPPSPSQSRLHHHHHHHNHTSITSTTNMPTYSAAFTPVFCHNNFTLTFEPDLCNVSYICTDFSGWVGDLAKVSTSTEFCFSFSNCYALVLNNSSIAHVGRFVRLSGTLIRICQCQQWPTIFTVTLCRLCLTSPDVTLCRLCLTPPPHFDLASKLATQLLCI